MPVLLAIGLNILIAAVLYLVLNRKIDRRMSPDEMLDQIQRDVEEIITELNQTTDRNIGLIEDRVESLRSILENVDKRIGLLRRESEKQEASTALYNDILRRARTSNATGSAIANSAGGTVSDTAAGSADGAAAGSGFGTATPASRQKKRTKRDGVDPANMSEEDVAPDPRDDRDSAATEAESGRKSMFDRVMQLHRQGFTSEMIAGRLGATLGEVELILSLQKMSQVEGSDRPEPDNASPGGRRRQGE